MKRRVRYPSISVFVSLVAIATVAGCGLADVDRTAVGETGREVGTAITDGSGSKTIAVSETTASAETEERRAVAQAGDGKAVAESGAAKASAEDGKARAGSAAADDSVTRAGDGETKGSGSPSGKAVLRITGDPGTRFSGACILGNEKSNVAGQVPKRFAYGLDGRKLECEIRKARSAGGLLQISAKAGGVRRNTVVRGRGVEVSFALTERGVNFSTFSSGSGGSVSQETKINSSSDSSVSSSSDTR